MNDEHRLFLSDSHHPRQRQQLESLGKTYNAESLELSWTGAQTLHSHQRLLVPSRLATHLEVKNRRQMVSAFSHMIILQGLTRSGLEPADLGQLSAVFEVLRQEFQPRTQAPVIPRVGTPTSSLVVSPSDGEESRTVWTKSGTPSYSDSDGEGDYIGKNAETEDGIDQPSLGYLDDVLGFLAAERAKFTAQREAGLRGGQSSQSQASTSESAWRHVIEPRRRRRRKRNKNHLSSMSASASGTNVDLEADGDGEADAEGVATPVGDALDGSSSGEYWSRGKSMPATPPHGTSRRLRNIASKGKGKEPMTVTIPGTSATIPVHPKLTHSRSTPSLRVTIPTPPDARVLRLRTLATKLRMLFTEDARHLSSVLLNDAPGEDGFIDPRGRPPEGPDDPFIHVFIDQ